MPLFIDVSQKKISIGDKYTIAVNGQPMYKAAAKLFKLFPSISVSPLNGPETPIITVEQKMGWLKPNYQFTINGATYSLETISWWKRRFAITAGANKLEIVGHRGRKVSIFINGKQVAWFDNEAVTFFSGDNYHVTANADAPWEWIVAVVLFWDSFYNRQQKGAINFKMGAMTQTQPFDASWQAS
ncbi:MAG TPA: hypothetical protein VFU15_05340 [Bacteroidia bacterium]|nr:hypothetical protein [Bacteroidia bacterium]